LGYNTCIHRNVTIKLPVQLSCIDKNIFFQKNRKQEGKTGHVSGWYHGEAEGYKERV
jgi:hypothetical protein